MQVTEVYQKIIEALPNYRVRPSQLQMINEIDACFNKANTDLKDGSHICLIEAPTGTGKSMAYILAGVLNAKKIGAKLIISTATKTLQSQLLDKDIPDFIKFSGIKFMPILAKGRSNYLCPYQLELARQNLTGDLLTESSTNQAQLNEISHVYMAGHWDGDLDNSPIHIENKLKPLITTDKDRCVGYSCPYNQKDDCQCPFYINREKLKTADVIITNHSLLLADLALGGGSVLPVGPNEYFLCLDEGHNFADIAIKSFTKTFELKHAISSCQNLAKLIYNPQTQSYVFTDIPLCDELATQSINVVEVLDELLFLLTQNQQVFNDNKLILNDYLNPNLGGEFRDRFVNLTFVSGELYAGLNSLIEKLKEQLKSNPDYLLESNLNKLAFYTSVVENILLASQYIINQDDSRYNANAKWVELRQSKGNEEFMVYAGLTHVGNILSKNLWSKIKAVVITSATLAIGDNFAYYKHKLGLSLYPKVLSNKLDTSFIYEKQSQIVVPRFKSAPEYNSRDEFSRELGEYLAKTLDYDEGFGTLVLFFNRSQLLEVTAMLPKLIQRRILLQTDYASNSRLLSEHKKNVDNGKPSIIFGLNSFAEGVDLPSIYCMHVIITKLPFDTHKDPQNMVQEYWVRFEKGNFFAEVALPEAGIRLIQACGRLIRDEGDYGQVSICDNRLVTKSYGNFLLNALPEFNRKYNKDFIVEAFAKITTKVN